MYAFPFILPITGPSGFLYTGSPNKKSPEANGHHSFADLAELTVYASLRKNSPGKLYGLINDSIMKVALRYFLIGKSRAAAVAARSAWSCDMMYV